MGPTTLLSPSANPFGSIVGQPLDDNQVDLADINSAAFEACQKLTRDVADGGYSACLTVFGDSGTGKTHLIGRVRKWLEDQPSNLFVFLRMETTPAGIWRHVRRNLAISLLRKNTNGVRAIDPLLTPRKDEVESLADRDLVIVLGFLLEGRHNRDASAWLRGEGLPEDALKAMQLSIPGPDDDLEAVSRRLVISLCGLIRPGIVVFCLDQIEALMSSPTDRDGPHAFGKAASCLVEETANSALICCVQSMFANLLDQILDKSARDKVMGRRSSISPLSWEQATRLIAARLDTVAELAAERKTHDSGWPLNPSRFREVFKTNTAPARGVIELCKDLLDEWRFGHPPTQEPLESALQSMLEARYHRKEPAEAEAILQNGMPLLARVMGTKCTVAAKPSPLDFTLGGGSVSVAICNEANATSLANHLKKISQSWQPDAPSSLILLRDSRLPISRNAKVTRERIAELEGKRGRLVNVSQEALEALAALRRLLSDAESGDLAHHGSAVTPMQVEKWIGGHMPNALDQLVSELGSPGEPSGGLSSTLAELLAEKKVVSLEEAARLLEAAVGTIEGLAERDPRQFGLLRGGVPTLFQPIATTRA